MKDRGAVYQALTTKFTSDPTEIHIIKQQGWDSPGGVFPEIVTGFSKI